MQTPWTLRNLRIYKLFYTWRKYILQQHIPFKIIFNTFSMDGKLDRHELPLQSVREMGWECTATVPIHLSILGLPPKYRTDDSFLEGSKEVVSRWYDEDMAYHLSCLFIHGVNYEVDTPWLRGYEQFNSRWDLRGRLNYFGGLALEFDDGENVHRIKPARFPVVLRNQVGNNGRFHTPKDWRVQGAVEVSYRGIFDSENVFMQPEKMIRYGFESSGEEGVIEVSAAAFCSSYHMNPINSLLLRNFAVFYLNRLLEEAKRLERMN